MRAHESYVAIFRFASVYCLCGLDEEKRTSCRKLSKSKEEIMLFREWKEKLHE